jgi:hypothetical protein
MKDHKRPFSNVERYLSQFHIYEMTGLDALGAEPHRQNCRAGTGA